MYILCCPQNQILEMRLLLKEFEVIPLPLINLEFFSNKIKYVEENIDNYDYVILSSPTVIEHLKIAISSAKKTIFITVGSQSANRIKQFTHNEVLFPEGESGRERLFAEKIPGLDFTNKKVLLVKSANIDSYNEIIMKYPSWEVLDIYRTVTIEPKNKECLKKLLTTMRVKGIIITTTILVDELFKLLDSLNCKLLLNIPFIVIHPKIRKKLEQNGIKNVHVTSSANKNEVLDLIRSLNV